MADDYCDRSRNAQPCPPSQSLWARARLEALLKAAGAIDVSKAAERLIDVCGAPELVLGASRFKLKRALGEGRLVAVITAARGLSLATTEASWLRRPVLHSRPLLVDYFKLMIAQDQVESVWAIFLDQKGRLLSSEMVHRGTRTGAALDARTILHLALDYGAEGIILAHNHPSGDPTPSATDHWSTVQLEEKCKAVDIRLWDHIVVASGGAKSVMWPELQAA